MGIKIMLTHTEADPVRFAFLHLFTKRPALKKDDGSPGVDKFEGTFIIKPGGANEKLVQDTIAEVCKEAWGDDWAEFYAELSDDNKGLRKGNLKRNQANEIYDGFEGMKYLTAKNATRPSVFIPGPDGQPVQAVEADGKPYSGCYGHAEVEIWAVKPRRGVSRSMAVSLCGCMFAKDGDAFGAGSAPSKADSFAGLSVADAGGGDAPKGGLFD